MTYGVGGSSSSVAGGSAVSYTRWDQIGVNGTAGSYTSGPINGTVDGISFTYTITVSRVGGSTGLLGYTTPGDNSLAEGEGDFENGEGFSVRIDNVSDSNPAVDVVFDGFIHFSMNFCGFESCGRVSL